MHHSMDMVRKAPRPKGCASSSLVGMSRCQGAARITWHGVAPRAAYLLMGVLVSSSVSAQSVSETPQARSYGEGASPVGRWRVGNAPLVVIGGSAAPGPTEFQMVGAITPLGQGDIAIADIYAAEIRVFDTHGRHVRTMGRRGRGPGEFGGIFGLWRVGDSLAAMDGAGVVQLFGDDGRYVRTVPRPSALGLRVTRIGYLKNGSFIGFVLDPPEKLPRGRSTRLLTLLRVDPDGSVERLTRFPAMHVVRQGTGTRPETVIYGPQMVAAVLSDRVCLGFPDVAYRFTCMDDHGKTLVNVIRKAGRPRLVTSADKEIYFHLALDSANAGPENAEWRSQRRKSSVFAERMAPFGRMVVSNNDELWVGPVLPAEWATFPNPVPPEPTVWSVYSREGDWLSDVTLPARFRLVAVDGGRVIGLVLEPGGTETIVAYPLFRKEIQPSRKGDR